MRKRRKSINSVKWGKRPNKRYAGVAGKGGKTTNFEIPAWMFDLELALMNGGAADA